MESKITEEKNLLKKIALSTGTCRRCLVAGYCGSVEVVKLRVDNSVTIRMWQCRLLRGRKTGAFLQWRNGLVQGVNLTVHSLTVKPVLEYTWPRNFTHSLPFLGVQKSSQTDPDRRKTAEIKTVVKKANLKTCLLGLATTNNI